MEVFIRALFGSEKHVEIYVSIGCVVICSSILSPQAFGTMPEDSDFKISTWVIICCIVMFIIYASLLRTHLANKLQDFSLKGLIVSRSLLKLYSPI